MIMDTHKNYADNALARHKRAQDDLLAPLFEKLTKIVDDPGDSEVDHARADLIMIEALEALGFPELAEAYRDTKYAIGFWYA